MFVTPTGADEVCIALLSSDSRGCGSIARSINFRKLQFVCTARRRRNGIRRNYRARPGARRSRGSVALVGDASCTIDGIAGQGLSLAFQEALHLAEAFAREDLSYYKSAHRRITRTAFRMTQLLLLMDRSTWIRRKTLRLFANNPAFFSKLISIHTGESSPEVLGMGEMFNLGWRVLCA